MVTLTANYTVVPGDNGAAFIVDASGGGFDITLPDTGTVSAGFSVSFWRLDNPNDSDPANHTPVHAQGSDVFVWFTGFPTTVNALEGRGVVCYFHTDGNGRWWRSS